MENHIQTHIPISEQLDTALSEFYRARHVSNANLKSAVIARFARLGEPAIEPLLLEWRSRDEKTHTLAIRCLSAIGDPIVPAMFDALNGKNRRERTNAIAVLRDIGTANARRQLCDALVRDLVRIRVRIKRKILFSILFIVLWSVMAFGGIPIKHIYPDYRDLIDMGTALFRFISQLFCLVYALDLSSNIRQQSVDALSGDGASDVIASLCMCLADPDEEVRKSVAPALKAHLPRVQATDRAQFTPEAMDALAKALGGKDRDLTLAILKALEQIGDGRALEAVERLASKSKDARVSQAAEECLPALRECAELARQSAILLRPVEAPADATLLRPAGKGEAEEALLLRPEQGTRDEG